MSLSPNRSRNSLRRAVHERPADDRLAADGLDQLALDQRRQHAGAAADAANLGDLRRRDRLLVGDHRERLERLHRQLLRGPLVEQLSHPLVQLGPRRDLVAARHLDDLQPAGPFVVGANRGERRVDVLLRLAVEELVERFRRDRLGRREDQRFDDRL